MEKGNTTVVALLKENGFLAAWKSNLRQVFVEAIVDRKSETLLEVINDLIEPGNTIISDCWKVYDCLKDEMFQHLTVNHTYNFVDPDTRNRLLI